MGLGVPGRVLPREGRVVFSPNVPALNDCPLVERLAPLVNWPLFLENDANLFALGEHWLGAGVGHEHLLGITLGTGVGGGLILNGRLWAGRRGHERGNRPHDRGPGGPANATAATGAAWRPWPRPSGRWPGSRNNWPRGRLPGCGNSTPPIPTPFRAKPWWWRHCKRDPLARRAFDRVGRSLGQAIAAVVHLLGLSRVVIGGRFARAWEVFQSPLQEELHRRLTLFPPEAVSVCPAQLGDDAGLVGAARLAWQAVEKEVS